MTQEVKKIAIGLRDGAFFVLLKPVKEVSACFSTFKLNGQFDAKKAVNRNSDTKAFRSRVEATFADLQDENHLSLGIL